VALLESPPAVLEVMALRMVRLAREADAGQDGTKPELSPQRVQMRAELKARAG
jgi:hypothetical protein